MIRFLIDQFRNAPGPLKTPRILVADLAEEVLDMAKHYLNKDNNEMESPCCGDTTVAAAPAPAPAANPKTPSEPPQAAAAPPAPTADNSPQIDPRLTGAIAAPGNARKQAFKVLAILWDASDKKLGALSAKAISKHGDEILQLQIRHENVRKVIRMRLENYVNVHAQGVGNGTVYNYEMSEAGLDYFMKTYFS